MRRITLIMILVFGGMLLGCGSKKSKVKSAEEADAGTAAEEGVTADGMEAEANTGPTEYPAPPSRNAADRKPNSFKVSVKKAYVLPLSEDGACFDPCDKELKTTLVDALPGLAGEQFGSAAKALTTAVGAKGAKDALPDIYVHLNCGSGQELTTHKTSAENRLAATWRGAGETLKLDVNDQCAISVWDADEDGNDELLGSTQVPIIKVADAGSVVLTSEDNEFGQVYLVELFLEQLDGESVWKAPATASAGSSSSSGTSGSTGSTGGGTAGTPSTGSGGGATTSEPAQPTQPTVPGAKVYKVEIIKANLKKTKKSGEKWDTKLPFVGKAGDEAPDPFCSAYVNGHQSENPFMKTSAASNTNYTEWRESGEAQLKDGDKIHFMVWDKDKLDHDLMGECITDTMAKVKSGYDIVMRNCGQVDFLVVKITRK